MATVSFTRVMSSFSNVKMIVFALVLFLISALLVHLTIRDFHAVTTAGQSWTPGYGKPLPKFSHVPQKAGGIDKSVELGLGPTKPSGGQLVSEAASRGRQRLPSCLIVGFANTGVRKLREILSLHPEIVTPTTEVKFFTENFQLGQTWYRKQMPLSSANQVTVEATQDYVSSPAVVSRISKFDSNLKLIVVAQDPVHKLILTYSRDIADQPPPQQTYREWCGYIYNTPKILKIFNYETPIREVYKHFPPNSLFVLSKEEVETDPKRTIQKVEDFLKLQHWDSSGYFLDNTTSGGTCFDKNSPNYRVVEETLTADIVLDPATGCIVIEDRIPIPPGIREDSDFFQKSVNAAQKSNARFFHLIRTTFEWKTVFDIREDLKNVPKVKHM